MSDLELTTRDRVMVARLNRPEKKNALSEPMLETLRAALKSANDDPGIGCFVITGEGDAFCSGGDLGRRGGERAGGDPTPLERRTRLQAVTHQVARAVEDFEKPLIAAVNGAAVGAGMDLALMCDLRLGSASARFSEGYIRVGLLPGNGGCYFLPRLVGPARALELLWTGDFVSADEALRIGLVNHVYSNEEFPEAFMAFAARIASGPPVQLRDIKKLMYQSMRTDLRTSLDSVAAHMAVIQSTDDYKEAVQAFKEKRKPVFTGQ
ncbi:enoyl-CoA hydratase/isomerase family protein [Pigmentiphaga litoralis]|uniref:2-(1,2-epoxy-1,2-dihydrophenyl)acetyl-CoA isomerase n=1 Tax=Pigmentiphaga litoralis TaxID=516702 RepID=A0A7Y9IUD2_9BURK|nr:enoyl-CoA hydratase-related protein [Pigmentiphaga litoralis]NYE23145.1 2-(1,2-epoxy-1,2-dihydrophenyl)acetyl-CoA isomerase [Pigmentiphaga litoralis]NYE83240.1 2-(1,2-epoxy-1,2-dihydrophenyl)acetyl-CoA isomerase [Pigmentiphaga litoralis]